MARLSEEEMTRLVNKLLSATARTPYPCNSLTPMQGGTTSFVFHGRLSQPYTRVELESVDEILVKHTTNFASINQSFVINDHGTRAVCAPRHRFASAKILTTNQIYEHTMLTAFEVVEIPISPTDHAVSVPRSLQFDDKVHVHIMEYIPNARDLASTMRDLNPRVDSFVIGLTIGAWLRHFHTWTSLPDQSLLRQKIAGNEPMRLLKRRITYDTILGLLESFPTISDSIRCILKDVQTGMKANVNGVDDTEAAENWGVVHGDCWMGKYVNWMVLLPLPVTDQVKYPCVKTSSVATSATTHNRLGVCSMQPSFHRSRAVCRGLAGVCTFCTCCAAPDLSPTSPRLRQRLWKSQ